MFKVEYSYGCKVLVKLVAATTPAEARQYVEMFARDKRHPSACVLRVCRVVA